MQVVARSVNWVCASRPAHALALAGIVAGCVIAVILLGFETPSGHICIMRDYAEMNPSAAIVEAMSGGHCVEKWKLLGHLLLATVALGGVAKARRAFRMRVVARPVNWVCASRPAHAFALAGIVAGCVIAVSLLEFETPSGYICIMRDYAEMDPLAATVEAMSGGHCVGKWDMLGHLLLATVALGGVPAVWDPAVGMPMSRAWRRAVARGLFKVENNWAANAGLFGLWRQQREVSAALGRG